MQNTNRNTQTHTILLNQGKFKDKTKILIKTTLMADILSFSDLRRFIP